MALGYYRYRLCLLGILLGWCIPASAQTFEFSGETSLASNYLDDELSVYTEGPVVQPDLLLVHLDSGCYVNAWASVGLKHSSGDELDLNFGCEKEIANGVTLDAWVGYDIFAGSDMLDFSGVISYQGASFAASYYVPVDGVESKGVRLKASYTEEWESFSLTASVVHDTGPYGLPPITTAGLSVKYALSDSWSISLGGRLPISQQADDERKAELLASLTWSF